MYDVELVQVTKRFRETTAVDDLSLGVRRGEFLTLLGPSGCGKTTTLNMLAGFIKPDRGEVRLAGQVVNHLPPNRRDTAMVFQQYALFPHMTVFNNIAFGLRMRKLPKQEIVRRVDRALEVVRLSGLGDRRVTQLSGGQQQRVALARAIVVEPTVLLMDEPLSNLDLKLREKLRLEIKNIQRQLGLTAVYVTHDQGEALVMSDRVAVMNNGVIEQLGSPAETYERPRTAFVASFIGTSNFLQATTLGRPENGRIQVKLADDTVLRATLAADGAEPPNGAVTVAVRPEHLLLGGHHTAQATGEQASFNRLTGVVQEVTYLGSMLRYVVQLSSQDQVIVEEPNRDSATRVRAGQDTTISIHPSHCLVMENKPVVTDVA